MTLSRRERFYGGLTILLVGILVLDQFVLEPGLARWDQAGILIEKADREIATAEKVLAREKDAQAKWDALKGQMRKDSLDDALKFVDHLWALAAEAGTSFQKTEELKRVEPRGDFNEISYDVRLQCGIANIANFVFRLDGSPELLRIRRLQVTARPGGQMLDVDVQISTLEAVSAPAAPPKKG
jgi:hypothetical protein